jgi:predicted transposase YdaD
MGIEEFVLDRAKRMGLKQGLEQGLERGREEGMSIKEIEEKTNFTKNLLTQTDFDEEKIASLVGVDVEFVRQVKASLT